MIPTPGAGWDANTLTPTTTPESCDSSGFWDWYNTITGTNTTTNNVGTVGPGFAFESPLGNPFNIMDANPGNNFGDAGNLIDCPLGALWTYCWEITANECLPNITDDDLSMSVQTYGDSETGNYNLAACENDPVNISFTSVACCQEPMVVIDETTCLNQCNGQATATGLGVGPFDYVWMNDNGTVIRSITSTGTDQITGLCGGIIYTVNVTDSNDGCIRSLDFIIQEEIPPSVVITPVSPNFCLNESVDLTAAGSNGTGLGYTYNWTQPDAGTISGAIISASQIGTYTITIRLVRI